jgi:hypothetical protein
VFHEIGTLRWPRFHDVDDVGLVTAIRPDWLTLNERVSPPPLTVIVPERDDVDVLEDTLYWTVPEPLPDVPLVTEIHVRFDDALHDVLDDTEMLPVPVPTP